MKKNNKPKITLNIITFAIIGGWATYFALSSITHNWPSTEEFFKLTFASAMAGLMGALGVLMYIKIKMGDKKWRLT